MNTFNGTLRKPIGLIFVMVALGLLISCVATFAVSTPAFADDVNTGYGFYLKSKGATDGTEWRHKGAEGDAYIHITYHAGHHCRLYIDGAKTREGADARNCMIGKAYDARDGEYRMENTVRSARYGNADYHYARLTAWAPVGEGSTNGMWSPDCSGRYPVINIK